MQAVRSRALLALLLLVATATLVPLAHAANVDPSWGGLYDNGDFDDVILCITSAVGVVDAQPLHDVGPVHDITSLVLVETPHGRGVTTPSFSRSRAPPSLLQ